MKACFVVAVLLCLAVSVLPLAAQPIGLPVADLAEPGTQGYPGFACGAAFALHGSSGNEWSSDASTVGVRGMFWLLDELRVFGDLTLLSNEELGSDMGLQIGALSPIPTDALDLALRGTVYGVDGDEHDVYGATGLLLWSTRTPLDSVAFYAGAGVGYKHEERPGETETLRDDEFNPMLDFGTLIMLSDELSLYGEILYDDQWSVNGGLRFTR